MREILFRGKRIDNGEWIRGSLALPNCKTHHGEIFLEGKVYICPKLHGIRVDELNRYERVLYGFREVDPETVGQYTGLTDKNGKKIFEGDIIKIPDDYNEFGHNAGEIYEIYFCCGGFRLKPKYSKARGYWLEDDRTVEVIGNIHDNPELLKGAENDL